MRLTVAMSSGEKYLAFRIMRRAVPEKYEARSEAGASQRSLAKEYGVSKSAIAAIMQGELYGWCTDEKRRNDFGRM